MNSQNIGVEDRAPAGKPARPSQMVSFPAPKQAQTLPTLKQPSPQRVSTAEVVRQIEAISQRYAAEGRTNPGVIGHQGLALAGFYRDRHVAAFREVR